MKNTRSKIQIAILLFISSSFLLVQTALSTEKLFEEERYLPKDIKHMKNNDGKFIVDDEVFNLIHKPVYAKDIDYSTSASCIKGKDKNICSATLIGLKKQNPETIIGTFLTAGHCLEHSPSMIYQGMTDLSSENNNYENKQSNFYIASYKPTDYSLGSNDTALIKAKLTRNNTSENNLFISPAEIVEEKITQRQEGKINHYPFGDKTQRFNEGTVHFEDDPSNERKKHEITTLPGSSGAGVFSQTTGKLFGVHTGSEKKYSTNKLVKYDMNSLSEVEDKYKTQNLALYNQLTLITKGSLVNFKEWKKIDE